MGAFGLKRSLFWLVVVASWWITSASIIVFADEPASNATNAASEATSVLQEPDAASPSPKAKWQFNGFVDAGYLLDFNHPANHLFRSRSTAFKVDELDLNMAGAGVIKLALCQGQFHLHSSLGRRLHSLPNVWGERELPLLQKNHGDRFCHQ